MKHDRDLEAVRLRGRATSLRDANGASLAEMLTQLRESSGAGF